MIPEDEVVRVFVGKVASRGGQLPEVGEHSTGSMGLAARRVKVKFRWVFSGKSRVKWRGWAGSGSPWEFCVQVFGAFWNNDQSACRVAGTPRRS